MQQLALQHIDASAEGRYQSAFSMSASGARILGRPLVALPLVLHAGSSGWVLLSVVMSAACVAVVKRSLDLQPPRPDR